MGSETVVLKQSDVSLDLFNGEDQPTPNQYHTSDVKLVDLKRTSINDDDQQPSYFNGVTAEELVVESKIDDSENSADAFDSKALANENDSSEEMVYDENFKKYMQHLDLTSNEEKNGKEIILEENDDAEKEEEMEKMSKTFSRMVKKFTIESDIEEADEEMEESISSRRATMAVGSVKEMLGMEALLMQAKSKLMLRAASILEQRLKTISDLKDLFRERKKLEFKNRFLNDKCCQYLKKTANVNYFENTAGSLPIHGNQRYYNVLEEFIDMKIHYDKTKSSLEFETQNLTDSYYICRSQFEQVFGDFMSRELEVGSDCVDSRTGKALNEQKIHSMMMKQEKRFDRLGEVRMIYLKLHNRLVDIHKILRALNFMGEGHTLMEYEQLAIINNTSMDKLDEREEELRKLRNQCIEDVSILSYMKLTSEAYVHDIMDETVKLEEVTEQKNVTRSMLAVERLKRDLLRKNSLKIQSVTGLLTSPRLLKKLELDLEFLTDLKRQVHRFRRGTVIIRQRA